MVKAKKVKTEEELEKEFAQFRESEVGEIWEELATHISQFENEPEMATIDIWEDWRPFLAKLVLFKQKLKIKSKNKVYDQEIVRTFWFERPPELTFKIDGVTYEIGNQTKVDFWNHKENLYFLIEDLKVYHDSGMMNHETFANMKKEVMKKMKQFDKNYTKHKSKTYKELNEIIQRAFQPLVNVLNANLEFHKLEQLMLKDSEIPMFRHKALEHEFCQHMEKMLTILTDHGKLRDEFNIQRMLDLLKVDEWEMSIPMDFYLTPLKESIISLREELLDMQARGLILCKYRIEENVEMHERVNKMVANDVTCQWLMGNLLKRDQFCFIYDVFSTIFDSPCKEKFLAIDKDIIETTIPMMVAFQTILKMSQILKAKKKKEEKLKKQAIPISLEETTEEEKPLDGSPGRPEKEEDEPERDPEAIAAEEELKEEEEREEFGRYWIWEEYFSENKRELWQASAELMCNVNEHVLQDIQDHILMKIFKLQKKEDFKQMHDQIQDMKKTKEFDSMQRTMQTLKKKAEKEEHELTENARFDDEHKKRSFCVQLRPPFVWNFFGEEEERLEHLIDPLADPEQSYKYEEENRITKLLQASIDLGINLKTHDADRWKSLVEYTIEIFKDEHDRYMSETAIWNTGD